MFKVNNNLTYFAPCFSVSIVNFEQINAGWKGFDKKTLIKCLIRVILYKSRDSEFKGLHYFF